MAQVNENVIFRNKTDIPTILGLGAPSFRKPFSGNVLPLSQNAPNPGNTPFIMQIVRRLLGSTSIDPTDQKSVCPRKDVDHEAGVDGLV